MPKHRISRKKAREMVDKFKKRRNQGPSKPLPTLPDGYIFESHEVKELLNRPGAHYFVINLGISESSENGKPKESISPILCITDINYNILSDSESASADGKATPLSLSSGFTDDDDDDGTFLDESKPIPPPYLDL